MVGPDEARIILEFLSKLDSTNEGEQWHSLHLLSRRMARKDVCQLIEPYTPGGSLGRVLGVVTAPQVSLLAKALGDGRPLDSFKESLRRIASGTPYHTESPWLAYDAIVRKTHDTNAITV